MMTTFMEVSCEKPFRLKQWTGTHTKCNLFFKTYKQTNVSVFLLLTGT